MKIRSLRKEIIIWWLFLICALIGAHEAISGYRTDLFDSFQISLILIPLLTLLFMGWSLGWPRGLSFLALAMTVGFISEFLSLNTNFHFFADAYAYDYTALAYGKVPIMVPIFWACLMALAYNLTTTWMIWLKQRKPTASRKEFSWLALAVLLDGLALTALDLFMDPIMVKLGCWRWVKGGQFYQVPIGNFASWFLITIISVGAFRLYEFYKGSEPSRLNKRIFVAPTVAYLVLCLFFIFAASQLRLGSLPLVGTLFMLPFPLFNFLVFWKRKENLKLVK